MNQELLKFKAEVQNEIKGLLEKGKTSESGLLIEISIGDNGHSDFGAGMVIGVNKRAEFCYYTGEYSTDELYFELAHIDRLLDEQFETFDMCLSRGENMEYIRGCISVSEVKDVVDFLYLLLQDYLEINPEPRG